MNSKNTEETVVVFRRWLGDGSIIALFPYEKHDRNGVYCVSYEHTGQHGKADYSGVVSRTKPVDLSDQDVIELANELTRIGYILKIVKRASYTKRIYAPIGEVK